MNPEKGVESSEQIPDTSVILLRIPKRELKASSTGIALILSMERIPKRELKAISCLVVICRLRIRNPEKGVESFTANSLP